MPAEDVAGAVDQCRAQRLVGDDQDADHDPARLPGAAALGRALQRVDEQRRDVEAGLLRISWKQVGLVTLISVR